MSVQKDNAGDAAAGGDEISGDEINNRATPLIPQQSVHINVSINGEAVSSTVEPRVSLVDFLRISQELTGSHAGCEHGVCGACTVRVNGSIVRGCLMLAVQADGCIVETIEGMADSGELQQLQDAFHRHNALQCGFCTPGMLLTAHEFLHNAQLHTTGEITREQIREAISGNYCRCTGYQAIVDAIFDLTGELQDIRIGGDRRLDESGRASAPSGVEDGVERGIDSVATADSAAHAKGPDA